MTQWGRFVLTGILTGLIAVSAVERPVLTARKPSLSKKNRVPGAAFQWHGSWERVPQTANSAAGKLRILAIRLQFQPDEDPMTTGDGTFLTDPPETPVINAPPHDSTYFAYQLQALDHYYSTVSKGRLKLTGHVFSEIIDLPKPMGEYNPGTTEDLTDRGLAELMRDGITGADQAGAPFADYDVVFLFHAGVGRDIELGYDPTSKDIPSAFLDETDLAVLGGEYAEGIPVQNGSLRVTEAVILPETQNQEGFEIGLLGTMTLMFGFQLGMPALWNTETGASGVGRWGMMDQGSGNYNGMIPCEPCAFTKVLMGWETPVEVRNGTDLTVACAAAENSRKIIKVPINDQEYYLVENRQYDANKDSVTFGTDADGRRIRFPSVGFLELEEPVNVLVGIDEYDYGLPGSGILIWHIDEKVILENLESNRVNADPRRRGVDLEEADGAQDIGESYGFLSGGSGAEGGVLHDAWFADNKINKLANRSDTVEFSNQTYPDTRSNGGGVTHIRFFDFSESDTVMTFSVTTDGLQAGFPQQFPDHDEYLPPLVGDLDGDGDREIVIVGSYDYLYIWNHDGTGFMGPGTGADAVTLSGETVPYTAPLMPLGVYRNRKIDVLGDWDGDGRDELVVSGDRDGEIGVHIFQGTDEDRDGRMDREAFIPFDPADLPVRLLLDQETRRLAVISFQGFFRVFSQTDGQLSETAIPLTLTHLCKRPGGGYMVTAEDGTGAVLFLDASGNLAFQYALNDRGLTAVSALIDGFGETAWISGVQGAWFWNTGIQSVEPVIERVQAASALNLAVADIDQDGFPEMVRTGEAGVLVFERNGTLGQGFPAQNFRNPVNSGSPLIADVNGDGQMELIVPQNGNIEFFSSAGDALDNLTLSPGSDALVSIDDVDLDGDMEILAVTDGWLTIWDLEAPYSAEHVPWGYESHDPGRTGFNPAVFIPRAVTAENWMPKHLAYNYPNPNEEDYTIIRYRLERAADVTIKIHDLAGRQIAAFHGPGIAQADNEVRWNLSQVAGGVYVCHIKAASGHETRETTFKIGVVK
jgi:M6 family metalloprotease-like protein